MKRRCCHSNHSYGVFRYSFWHILKTLFYARHLVSYVYKNINVHIFLVCNVSFPLFKKLYGATLNGPWIKFGVAGIAKCILGLLYKNGFASITNKCVICQERFLRTYDYLMKNNQYVINKTQTYLKVEGLRINRYIVENDRYQAIVNRVCLPK